MEYLQLLFDVIFSNKFFIGMGLALWALSFKFRMNEYGQQKFSLVDLSFFVVGMCLDDLYYAILDPSVTHFVYSQIENFKDVATNVNSVLQLVAYYIISDFFGYWAHRSLHSKWMWRFHAFHHSAKHLNVFSGMRAGPVHTLVILFPYTVVATILLFTKETQFIVPLLVLDSFNQNFIHTNLRVPFAKYLEYVLVTPRLHFLHHDAKVKYTNSNYGFVFSCWDRIFGTYTDPDRVTEKRQLGLDYESDNLSLFLGFKIPFSIKGSAPVPHTVPAELHSSDEEDVHFDKAA